MRFELWRQDDNGNRVVIARYATEAEARAACAMYEARGHKQLYWIVEVDQRSPDRSA